MDNTDNINVLMMLPLSVQTTFTVCLIYLFILVAGGGYLPGAQSLNSISRAP